MSQVRAIPHIRSYSYLGRSAVGQSPAEPISRDSTSECLRPAPSEVMFSQNWAVFERPWAKSTCRDFDWVRRDFQCFEGHLNLNWGRWSDPHLWARLDRPHCIKLTKKWKENYFITVFSALSSSVPWCRPWCKPEPRSSPSPPPPCMSLLLPAPSLAPSPRWPILDFEVRQAVCTLTKSTEKYRRYWPKTTLLQPSVNMAELSLIFRRQSLPFRCSDSKTEVKMFKIQNI